MAPPSSSSSSSSSSPPAAAVGQGGPAAAQPIRKVYHCNFCDDTFKTCYGLSGHYNVHKNLPHEMWIQHGPRHSKIRRDILEALKTGKEYQYKRKTWRRTGRARRARAQSQARVLSPQPIREVHPTDNNNSSPQLPWCALGVPNGWGWASYPDPADRDPTGKVIRVQGPGGLLVLRKDYGKLPDFATKPHFRTTGPVVRIQGPNGLLIRRDTTRAEPSSLTPVGPPPGFPVKDTNGAGSSSSNSTQGLLQVVPRVDAPPGFPVRGINGPGSSSSNPALARNDGPPSSGLVVRNISAAELYGPRPKTKPPVGPERAPAPALRAKYGIPTIEYTREKSGSVPDLNLPSSSNSNKKIIKLEN